MQTAKNRAEAAAEARAEAEQIQEDIDLLDGFIERAQALAKDMIEAKPESEATTAALGEAWDMLLCAVVHDALDDRRSALRDALADLEAQLPPDEYR